MSAERTERLFVRFRAIFGSRWGETYKTQVDTNLAVGEWAELIEKMSDEQIVRAIAWTKTTCHWPPSLAEFVHAGLEIDDARIRERVYNGLSSWDRGSITNKELAKRVSEMRAHTAMTLVSEGFGRPALIGIDVR